MLGDLGGEVGELESEVGWCAQVALARMDEGGKSLGDLLAVTWAVLPEFVGNSVEVEVGLDGFDAVGALKQEVLRDFGRAREGGRSVTNEVDVLLALSCLLPETTLVGFAEFDLA
jgi:hypothetical protein